MLVLTPSWQKESYNMHCIEILWAISEGRLSLLRKMLAMLGMIRNAGSISDNKQNENHQSRVHGTHYVGRSFADVMQEINTRPIIDQDINELNLEWLFKDEKTVFVVSSDFCHWGRRFDFMY